MSLVAAIIVAVMLFFTTPAGIGPLGIFVFFLLVYVVVLGVMMEKGVNVAGVCGCGGVGFLASDAFDFYFNGDNEFVIFGDWCNNFGGFNNACD